MAQAVFRCSNAQGHVIDGRVANVDDLIDAREYAARVARSLIAAPTLRDWRSCCLSVSDDLGVFCHFHRSSGSRIERRLRARSRCA
jgi:hypothetical protein